MKNISNFTATSQINPEIARVYVYDKGDGYRYAVATDSFKLAEQNITDLSPQIPSGYYDPKIWKSIVGAFNKKKVDIETIERLTKTVENPDRYTFPDYKQIMPQEKDIQPINLTETKLTLKHFQSFIELVVASSGKYQILDLSEIKENGKGMIFHENKIDGIKVLLMKHNK